MRRPAIDVDATVDRLRFTPHLQALVALLDLQRFNPAETTFGRDTIMRRASNPELGPEDFFRLVVEGLLDENRSTLPIRYGLTQAGRDVAERYRAREAMRR